MKKTYTITYANQTSVYRQLTVMGTLEQASRFAQVYAERAHLMGTSAIIAEVAA